MTEPTPAPQESLDDFFDKQPTATPTVVSSPDAKVCVACEG